MKFTKTQLRQLLAYVNDRDDGMSPGWYYGNRKQFEKRHAEILRMIEAELRKPSNAALERTKEGT